MSSKLTLIGDRLVSRRILIAERDNWTCQLCLLKIHTTADLSIDHKHPKSKGGSNDMENLQATHRVCNYRKGSNEQKDPEWYRRTYPAGKYGVGTPKKKNKKPSFTSLSKETKPTRPIIENSHDIIVELYNELARNYFKNLSFHDFEKHFERYFTERTKGKVLIDYIRNERMP